MDSPDSPATNRHSIKVLAKVLLSRMENQKMIEFSPKTRAELQSAFESHLSQKILTDEDFTLQARAQVAARSEEIAGQNLTESEALQSQKRALRSKYKDNAIRGFYLKDSLRAVSQSVVRFLFDSPLIEDVFETDEALSALVMSTLQSFDESKIAG